MWCKPRINKNSSSRQPPDDFPRTRSGYPLDLELLLELLFEWFFTHCEYFSSGESSYVDQTIQAVDHFHMCSNPRIMICAKPIRLRENPLKVL